jgi:hypothetical protein
VNIKITVFCSMTCLLLLHGGRARWMGKNGDLSTAGLGPYFPFPTTGTRVLRTCGPNSTFPIPHTIFSCLGCSFNKETLLKFQLSCVQLYPLTSHFMSSNIFSLCLPSYFNGVCSTFLHITNHTARLHTVPFLRKRISITSALINKVILKICGVSFRHLVYMT